MLSINHKVLMHSRPEQYAWAVSWTTADPISRLASQVLQLLAEQVQRTGCVIQAQHQNHIRRTSWAVKRPAVSAEDKAIHNTVIRS